MKTVNTNKLSNAARFGLLALLLLSSALASRAQNIEASQLGVSIPTRTVVSGTWTTGFYSRSFASGDGLILADEPVVQSELKLRWERARLSGLFKVRGSKGFKDNWTTFSDEVDLATEIGYAGPADLAVSFNHVALVPAAVTDVQYVEMTISKTIFAWRPE